MTHLPPPSLPSPGTMPDDATPSPRRRLVIGAAIAGSGLAVAAIVAGTTAIASSNSSSEPPTAVATDAVPTVENDGTANDVTAQLPPELDEFIAGSEQFGRCLSEQLDIPMDGQSGSGTVIVGDPSGEGDLTIIEFGDGDGSVTVERSGGEIAVETDGDVTVTTGDEIVSNLDELFDDAGTAFEACRDTLPELPPLDEVFGSLPDDFNLDDFNLDDFDLDDFDLDDFDLDDFNFDDFDFDQLPDELELPNLDEFLQELDNLDLDQLIQDLFDRQN